VNDPIQFDPDAMLGSAVLHGAIHATNDAHVTSSRDAETSGSREPREGPHRAAALRKLAEMIRARK
jgi:hypothetical protein